MTSVVLIFLYGFVRLAVAELTVIPLDTEVMLGQQVRFLCSTSNPSKEIHWFYTPVGVKDKDKDLVYGFNQINPKYRNRLVQEKHFDTGATNLVIPSVEIRDSGKYTCQDEAGRGNKSSAQLIILDGSPVCQSNIRTDEVIGPNSCGIEADNLVFSCIVSHHGNVPPALEWRRVGANSPILEGVAFTYIENTTTCNLSMRGELSMDHASYVCQTTRATETQMSCVSDEVKILYAFSNFSITDKLIDDSVYCSANSSQSCNYEWKYYDESFEKTFEPGRNQTFKEIGLYRCEAHCQIKQKPCVVSASLVHVIPSLTKTGPMSLTKTEPMFFKAAFIVVLILLLTCIILITVYISSERRKRYRKPLAKNEKIEPATADAAF